MDSDGTRQDLAPGGTSAGDPASRLASTASLQHGAFTRAQALAAGWSAAAIDTRLRNGSWRLLGRGVYAVTAALPTPQRDRHRLAVAARLLALAPDHVASHRSAALLHGWPVLGIPPPQPLLSRSPRTTTDASSSRFVRVATLAELDIVELDGLQVTSPARTVVDVARHEQWRSAVVVGDAALRAGLDPEQLAEVAGRCRKWPGGTAGLQVVHFADGRADGPLESIARVAFAALGLPAPELQVEVRDLEGRLIGIVDFLWRAQRTVCEMDGLLKYDGDPFALRREKEREDDLRRSGLEVVRGLWSEAYPRPELLCRRVREAFALAARFGDLPVRHLLPPAA